jgi:hypothetical protein
MQDAVAVDVNTRQENGEIYVEVRITNDNTGHHIPTGSPLRQLILIVQVFDLDGNLLEQLEGPTIPDWAGVGNPDDGYYAGLPGTGYAKILEELWTEVSPTGAYWNQTRVLSDNRIAALESAFTTYTFAAAGSEVLRVEVSLIYRRAFISLADLKGWEIPDLEITHLSFEIPIEN